MRMIATVSLMLALLLSVGLASAGIVAPDVTFGNSNQDRNETVQVQVSVQNTEADTVTITGLASNTVPSKYQFAMVGGNVTIANGSTALVTLQAFVPLDHDAVDANLVQKALDIGLFTFSAVNSTNGTLTSNQSAVRMQAENRLDVRKVRADISGVTPHSDTLRDGDKLSNLKPEDKISLDVRIENNFGRRTDIDFDNIDIVLELSDDSDYNIDDDSDNIDLKAGDDDTVTFDMDIEDDARDGTTAFFIRVSGRDTNGAMHGQEFRANFDIERDIHDIIIKSMDVQPAVLSCKASKRSIELNTHVRNLGRVNEDDVIVEARVDALSIVQRSTPTDLDEDDNQRNVFRFDVPKDADTGVYDVQVTTFYDLTKKSNTESTTFLVEECKEEVVPEETKDTTVPATPAPAPVVLPPVTQPAPAPATPASTIGLSESDVYLVGLTAGIVVVAMVIVLLLSRMFMRRE